MPENPYEPRKREPVVASQRQLELSRSTLMAWVIVFFFPMAFHAALVAIDILGCPLDAPGTGAHIYWVPLASMVACWLIVLTSQVSVPGKVGWIAFTFVAMLVQLIAIIFVFGLINQSGHVRT